ncbi:unnamed protein product [Plutella xylostella]|uniref:(diamondback moth) hypothetical protein n=1 Tax=Plutella xylostella TaxID=51655 RepID=A0A8S4GEM9_PLUXY|nr:unnamed protein product [Plutella xylostella]
MAGRAAGVSGLSKATITSEDQMKVSESIRKDSTSKGSLAAPLLNLGGSTDSNSSQKSSAHKSSATVTGTSTTIESDGDKKEDQIEAERSSSPAFDSDEESTNQPNTKKRPSVANLVMQTGALQLLNNMRMNGGMLMKPSDMKSAATTPNPEPDKPKLSLSQISEKSLLDTDNPRANCLNQLHSDTRRASPNYNSATHYSPTIEFRASPPVSESPPSQSESTRARKLRLMRGDGTTYDVLVGLDGADLRFMDESSVIVPSPTIESPPSSITFPTATDELGSPPASNSGNAAATNSLLQAALIRATAEAQVVIPKNTFSPPATVKVNTEVSLTIGERPKPVITLVTSSSNNNESQGSKPIEPKRRN